MRGYDRGYDYGLRGWPQARERLGPVRMRYEEAAPRRRDGGFARGYDDGYRRGREAAASGGGHVTARYNQDYVSGPAGARTINYMPYGGDQWERIDDFGAY